MHEARIFGSLIFRRLMSLEMVENIEQRKPGGCWHFLAIFSKGPFSIRFLQKVYNRQRERDRERGRKREQERHCVAVLVLLLLLWGDVRGPCRI